MKNVVFHYKNMAEISTTNYIIPHFRFNFCFIQKENQKVEIRRSLESATAPNQRKTKRKTEERPLRIEGCYTSPMNALPF